MKAKRLTTLALAVCAGLIFSYVEHCLPLPFFLPGMKLGLSNIIIVFVLFRFSLRDALIVSLCRVTLSALLFGTPISAMYSLAGALCSLFGMYMIRRIFSCVGVGVVGGVFHTIGQLAVAVWLMHSPSLFLYLPVLLICGTVTGILTGTLAALCLARLGHTDDNAQ